MDLSKLLYTDVFKYGQRLLIRAHDPETGERHLFSEDYKPFLYVKTNNPAESTAKSLKGAALVRKDFESIKEMEQFQETYSSYDGFKMYGCRDPIYQYISTNWSGKLKFNMKNIRGAVVDIEVESGTFDPLTGDFNKGPFPEPSEANYPVTAITVYDTKLKCYVTLGLEWWGDHFIGTYDYDVDAHDKVKGLKVMYKGFKTEAELLNAFVQYMAGAKPDFISGYNSEGFDIPYLCNRIQMLLGQETLKKISPWGVVYKRTFTNSFGKDEVSFNIRGVANLDYKQLIAKHGFVNLKDGKLETAGQHFVGEGKLEYTGSLTGLYFTDYKTYINYNIRDVDIIRLIDDKVRFFQLTYMLTYLYHCNPEDTMGTVQPWIALLYERLHNRGQEPELRPIMDEKEYEGAYVKEPVPGRYKWGISVDAESLYPNMVKQFNMGVETILDENESYVMRVKLIEEIKQLQLQNGMLSPYMIELAKRIAANKSIHDFYWKGDPMNDNKVYKFKTLVEENVCMAPNLAFFSNNITSVFKEILIEFGDQRKVVKKEMLSSKQNKVNAKDSGDDVMYHHWDNEYVYGDGLQLAYKLVQNAFYGALANRWFREWFEPSMAEAITLAGQVSTRFIMKSFDEFFAAKTGSKEDYSMYGDTDSIYGQLTTYVQQNFGDVNIRDNEAIKPVVNHLDELCKGELGTAMVEWGVELSQALGCSKNFLIFKRESIFTTGVWTAKKRYALMVADMEGVRYPVPELKFTGLEARKSNYPDACRKALADCYEIGLVGTEDELHKYVSNFKSRYYAMPLNDIATPKGIGEIAKFIDLTEPFGYIKGTPSHVKAAILYNSLNAKHNLGRKPIAESDKIMVLPLLKGSVNGFDNIGYQDTLPPEFGLNKKIDMNESFSVNFTSPLDIYLNAIGWYHKPRASALKFFGS